jgi:mRNA interferase RelE/StbE
VSYEIEWAAPALRELRKQDKQTARRVLRPVTGLAADPRPAGVPALVGQPAGTMRLRVGEFRVVYVIEDEEIRILVVRVAHQSRTAARCTADCDVAGGDGGSKP